MSWSNGTKETGLPGIDRSDIKWEKAQQAYKYEAQTKAHAIHAAQERLRMRQRGARWM